MNLASLGGTSESLFIPKSFAILIFRIYAIVMVCIIFYIFRGRRGQTQPLVAALSIQVGVKARHSL